jgi:hypothetical protein
MSAAIESDSKKSLGLLGAGPYHVGAARLVEFDSKGGGAAQAFEASNLGVGASTDGFGQLGEMLGSCVQAKRLAG